MRTIALGAAIGCTLAALACAGSAPTAPTADPVVTGAQGVTADRVVTTSWTSADDTGVHKKTISGTMSLVGITPPERTVTTPSEMCHFFNFLEYTQVHGDLEGTLTYDASAHRTCDSDFTHLVASGPFTGEITFQGRTGTIKGQWTTNCKFDTALGSISCDGTMNARGAGGLEGVQFHFRWGPGWWPFPYTGTALLR